MAKRFFLTAAVGALALVALTGCSGDSTPTFTKDESDTTPVTVTLSAIDMEETSIAKGAVEVLGDDANALEIFDWYFEQEEVAFEHENGMITTVGDLAGDQSEGWMIYINDEMSDVGAEELLPADGDVVELRYVDYATIL